MLYKILHCPFNTFAFNPVFRLREAGGPQIKSAIALATAARLRTATTTIPHWHVLLRELREAAATHLPLARALSGRRATLERHDPRYLFAPPDAAWWPTCWDDKPFAWYLGEAADFFPSSPVNRVLHDNYDDLLSAARKNAKFQSLVSSLVHRRVHSVPLSGIVRTRLKALFPALVDRFSDDHSSRLLEAMKKETSHVAMSALKTVCNGWCTSHRMHEETLLDCLFGCLDGSDSLKHYLVCPKLWTLIDDELEVEYGSLEHRLGLHQVSSHTVRALFLAFHLYHALKVGHLGVALEALQSFGFSQPLLVARSSVRAARAIIGHRP